MNEQELGRKIAKLLDLSAEENIKQSTLYRLQFARRAALENCHPALGIMNSGNGTSVYGGHDQHLNIGKLLLLLVALFVFAVVSANYWQFLEKGRSAVDTTMLVDDPSTQTYIDKDPELDDDLSIDEYIDNVRKLVDDLSTDARTENEPALEDDVPADARIDNEPELDDDMPADDRIENEAVLEDDMTTDAPVDNELEEWLDSHK